MSVETEYYKYYTSDPRTTEELIQIALDSNSDPEVADGIYWQAMTILQHRLPTIIDRIRNLGGDDRFRELSATVLGQNSVERKVYAQECTDTLLTMLSSEASVPVIISFAQALGHLGDPRAVEALVPLRTHDDPGVRQAIAFGLLFHEAPMAIDALIELTSDMDRGVRNWATFGLAQCEVDTPAVREALALRLSEEDEEIRGEAISGLSRRGDTRVVDLVKTDRSE